jgi:hypothetical protein
MREAPPESSPDRRTLSREPRAFVALLLVAAAFVLAPVVAAAATYEGYGDTGWYFDNKRDCCEEAVWLAQDNAIGACEAAGGVARVSSGTARGSCSSDARGNSSNRVYRCTARTRVNCR